MLSQRVHPVPWEYGRLAKIVGVGSVVYIIGVVTDLGDSLVAALTWQLFLATGAFPILLLATGFLHPGERQMIAQIFDRIAPWRTPAPPDPDEPPTPDTTVPPE